MKKNKFYLQFIAKYQSVKTNSHSFIAFFKHAHHTFMQGNAYVLAQSLSFQTIFCIIPAIATIFAIISSMQILHIPISQVQYFLTSQFLPKAFSKTIVEQLQHAVENAQSAALLSASVFLTTSFFLIRNLESIYVTLSGSKDEVKIHVSLKNYILFLILFLLALFMGSGLIFMIMQQSFMPYIGITKIISYLLFSILIYCCYYFLSPIEVSKTRTFIASLLVALTMSMGQYIFAFYLKWFPAYMLIYGTIASIPLSLFWICCCWIVFLYGYCFIVCNYISLEKQNNLVQ